MPVYFHVVLPMNLLVNLNDIYKIYFSYRIQSYKAIKKYLSDFATHLPPHFDLDVILLLF